MDWPYLLRVIGAIAGVLILPLAIPGYAAVFSDRARDFMLNRKWVASVLIAALAATYAIDVTTRLRAPGTPEPALRSQYGKLFESQVVKLDGRAFYNCTFDNVIFSWNGGKSFMLNPRITGARGFRTEDQKISLTVDLFKNLGLLEPNFAASWTHAPSRYSRPGP